MFNMSLGIMVYNEEANIGRLLRSLLKQKITHCYLKEIFVVASGCTDRTEEIVRNFIHEDSRIKLLVQPEREGKASAINLFLSEATGDIFVLESGDTIPEEGALNRLAAPFEDPSIGMTGARPIPINQKSTFIGFTVHLMWSLHHRIALMTPKLGELVAFRNFIQKIPNDTAVDEACIEAIVRKAGYELYYVPDAIVQNKGPENIRDFIKQRRRISAGHKHLLREQKHEVSTSDPKKIFRIIMQEHSWNFRDTIWTAGAISLELIGRLLGSFDFYVRKKNPFIWDIAYSTKKLN
jgi:cellulose synthase/poly-beta-1,6-N-acetylglucosamine synthase-like glycosyltransferase